MKLTIEMDPTADKEVFDRVMSALTNATPTVNQVSTTAVPVEAPEETTPDDTPSDEKPRIYGEAGTGRKRRTKVEMAEDEEIETLAAETEMAISTDIPAAQMLADLKEAAAENTPDEKPDDTPSDEKPDDTPSDEKPDEDNFTMEEEPAEMSPEEFRGKVIALNKEHGKAAIAILSEYGSGLSKIPKEKYKEVLSRLQDLGNA